MQLILLTMSTGVLETYRDLQ